MLPQKHRLSKSAEVKKTTARGRSFFNSYFILKFIPGQEEVKITIIASVKVSKKAVVRNRIKRIIRDELRKVLDQFKPGDYVFIAKKAATVVESSELRSSLVKSLQTAKIIKEK